MSTEPFSILLIAPYQSMADSVAEICRGYPNIRLEPFIGNLDDGVRYCLEAVSICHYDLILSRGGTTTALRRMASIPIVDIEVSAYDMLRAILAAQQFGRPFAIIGFSNITVEAHQLCETVGWELNIHEVHGQEDAERIIHKLYEKEPRTLIVGDVISTTTAQVMGMSTILITSGAESISKALDTAVEMHASMSMDREKTQFFRAVLEEAADPVAVFDEGGNLLYTNCFSTNEKLLPMMDSLAAMIPQLRRGGTVLTRSRENGLMITVHGLRVGKPLPYYVFWMRAVDISLSEMSDAILIRDGNMPLMGCESLVESNEYMIPLMQQLREDLGVSKLIPGSVLLLRCPSAKTGASAALYLHLHGKEDSHCFISVNCGLLTQERWQDFLSELGTAFGSRPHTIYFENPEQLSAGLQAAVAEALRQNGGKYVILSSSVHDLNRLAVSGNFSQELFFQLCFRAVTILPLNERREDIPVYAQFLVQQYNKKYSRQIIGLPTEAIRMLQEFDWSMDAGQFEQVIYQTLRVSDGHYVSPTDLQRILTQIRTEQTTADETMKLTGTLDEIEMKIIRSVVAEENMNYTRAAKRLGISRSTLWRKLTVSRRESSGLENGEIKDLL